MIDHLKIDMAQVFTSYSRRDTEIVDTIVEKMSQAGISVWIDRSEIKAGNTWRVQIVKPIDTCQAFVLMLSPNSAASDNVRREIDLSHDSERTIFVVMLDPVRPIPAEIRYQLAGLQFIDVQMLGFDKAVDQLIETLKGHLAQFAPAGEPETRQTELVIQGINLKEFSPDKQAQLLDFIAQLTGADRSQLQIANLTTGSVHAFVNMPTQAAYELKTLALNRDPLLKGLGITSMRLDGDPASLEEVYPDKVDLPFPRDPRWPVPQNIDVARRGDEVIISWSFFDVPEGERESPNSPRYILELWLCRNGEVTFTPLPVYEDTKISVIDQAGCSEPSHGRIILVEKNGYVGPVEIEWPPYPLPTP